MVIFSQIGIHNAVGFVHKTIFILVSERSLNARLVLLFKVLVMHQKNAVEV